MIKTIQNYKNQNFNEILQTIQDTKQKALKQDKEI